MCSFSSTHHHRLPPPEEQEKQTNSEGNLLTTSSIVEKQKSTGKTQWRFLGNSKLFAIPLRSHLLPHLPRTSTCQTLRPRQVPRPNIEIKQSGKD